MIDINYEKIFVIIMGFIAIIIIYTDIQNKYEVENEKEIKIIEKIKKIEKYEYCKKIENKYYCWNEIG